MAMIALKCPHIEVSEPRQRDSARAPFLSFSFLFPQRRARKNPLFSLSERTRAPEILLESSFYRDDGVSLPLSLSRVAAFRSRSLFVVGRERRAPFFYLSFKGASMGKM
jgi:hypothetical protein